VTNATPFAGAAATIHPSLIVCDDCDAVYQRLPLAPGTVAHCARCGASLGRGHRLGAQARLALMVAALIALMVGNAFDIVTLDLRGVHVEATLYAAVVHTWASGERAVAALAGATAFVFPLAVIALRLWLLVPLVFGRRPPAFVPAMHALRQVDRWSMVEVFLIGMLIATVRSAGIGSAVVGPGLAAYGTLALLLAAGEASGLYGLWRLGTRLSP